MTETRRRPGMLGEEREFTFTLRPCASHTTLVARVEEGMGRKAGPGAASGTRTDGIRAGKEGTVTGPVKGGHPYRTGDADGRTGSVRARGECAAEGREAPSWTATREVRGERGSRAAGVRRRGAGPGVRGQPDESQEKRLVGLTGLWRR